MAIVQVVPRLPPAIDGIGDYALNLAHQLRQELAEETHFVVGDPTWKGQQEIEGFPVSIVPSCSSAAILSLLRCDRVSLAPVLLHYVGYGYARRGCPFWLVDGLQRWQSLSGDRSLVTMFHEVHASGRPPWTSSFWLSPLQRNLAARLARLSDRCLTNRQDYAKLLYKLSRGKQTEIPILPVFSSIGELEQVLPLSERKRQIVVFGSPSNRQRVYVDSYRELEQTCQQLGIEEILDIGPSTSVSLSTVSGVPVVELGQRSATEISSILSKTLAGFFNYNPEYLAKSTIFATYCAHGLLPVSAGCSVPVDGLEAGKHYWVPGNSTNSSDLIQLQAIANCAHAWYQTHTLSVQAKTFASLLSSKK
jgi:hypothetical protein